MVIKHIMKRQKKLVEGEVSWKKGKTSKRLTENFITHMEKEDVRFLVKREDGFYYEVLQDDQVFFSLVRKIITDFRKGKEKELADIAANETSKIMEVGGDILIGNDSEISLPGIGGNDTPSESQYILPGKLTTHQMEQIECIVDLQPLSTNSVCTLDTPQPTHIVSGKGPCVLLQPTQFFLLGDDGNVKKIEKDVYMSLVTPYGQGPFWPHKVVAVSEVAYTESNNTREILFDDCPIIITGYTADGYTVPPLFI